METLQPRDVEGLRHTVVRTAGVHLVEYESLVRSKWVGGPRIHPVESRGTQSTRSLRTDNTLEDPSKQGRDKSEGIYQHLTQGLTGGPRYKRLEGLELSQVGGRSKEAGLRYLLCKK